MPTWPNLHPSLVHFPIALLVVAPLFLLIGAWRKETGFAGTGLVLVFLGTVMLLLAFASGEAGEGRVPPVDVVQSELHEHEEHAGFARITFVVVLGLLTLTHFASARLGRVAHVVRVIALVAYVFGLTNVLAAAHHGGRLVHVHGVHVQLPE